MPETSKVIGEFLCYSSTGTFLSADPAFGSCRVELCEKSGMCGPPLGAAKLVFARSEDSLRGEWVIVCFSKQRRFVIKRRPTPVRLHSFEDLLSCSSSAGWSVGPSKPRAVGHGCDACPVRNWWLGSSDRSSIAATAKLLVTNSPFKRP